MSQRTRTITLKGQVSWLWDAIPEHQRGLDLKPGERARLSKFLQQFGSINQAVSSKITLRLTGKVGKGRKR